MEVVILKKRPFHNPPLRTIRKWVADIVRILEIPSSGFGIMFCGPRVMARYQSKFRGVEGVTDVLSFPGEDDYLGDVVICVDRAAEQAGDQGHSLEYELKTLLIHGILHCLGYDHEKREDAMLDIQAELLSRI